MVNKNINIIYMLKMYAALTFNQQRASNHMSQRCIPKVFSFQGPLFGIFYHLMQDQLSLYVILSGFTKRATEMSNKVISDCKLFMYCCALCCVLNSYRLYIVYMYVCSLLCALCCVLNKCLYLVIHIFCAFCCALNVCIL